MRILAIETELAAIDPQRHRHLLREEAEDVWALKQRDVIRDIWFTRQGRRAVVMLECGSEEEARQHLGSLPLVRERLIEFEVHTLLAYDGFDRLVAGSAEEPNK